ncbi:hypothetical protein WOLCODRAFT_66049 [Wolfiporia cocos MD-104 SS10]|uniref:Nascent polypeptide-associated complex subunit alpha-like UBA domain-containing protein n=1 Tax=Wolfiporia cocos (strain MD-104) TaxID=742152 RepID=A0A2H3JPI4_WOLCO|nr:hypothetical protein WOLCODRAFT_66049 [Wolfiporia cocos MD-104 SS10]
MSRTNGRPEPEVIVNFADGYAYSKGKMEEAFRSGLMDRPAVKPAEKLSHKAKQEDVDLLVHELDVTRSQAEKMLLENDNDIAQVLTEWVKA